MSRRCRVSFLTMVGDILQPTHLLLILLVALLVLGPKRLPEVGRSLGKGLRDFRGAMSGIQEQSDGFLNLDEPDPSVTPATPVNGVVPPDEAPRTQAELDGETGAVVAPAEPAVAPTHSVPSGSTAPAETRAATTRAAVHEPDPSEYAD